MLATMQAKEAGHKQTMKQVMNRALNRALPTCRSLFVAAALGALAAPLVAALVLPARPVLAQAAPVGISIDNFTFSPQQLTIKAGTTVTWTNRDDIPHAIAAV